MSKLDVFALLSAVFLIGFACKHEPYMCATPAEVSFQQDIVPMLNQHCSLTDCHAGVAPAGNLNLEASGAYAQLTQPGKGYIDTIAPRFSVVYASINSTSNPMPPTGKLEKCSLELVLRWIEQKAKNN